MAANSVMKSVGKVAAVGGVAFLTSVILDQVAAQIQARSTSITPRMLGYAKGIVGVAGGIFVGRYEEHVGMGIGAAGFIEIGTQAWRDMNLQSHVDALFGRPNTSPSGVNTTQGLYGSSAAPLARERRLPAPQGMPRGYAAAQGRVPAGVRR
jgi:hypothetical protein